MASYTARLATYLRSGLATDSISLKLTSIGTAIAIPRFLLESSPSVVQIFQERQVHRISNHRLLYQMRCLLVLILASGLSIPGTSRAEFSRGLSYEPRPEVSRYEQRKQYQDIIYGIKSGQRSRYLKTKDQLRDYPLYPYLEYTDKIYRLSRQTPDSIMAFIELYGDTPLANQLLQNWLYNLAKRGEWKLFL
jgi:hypothetical protein